MLQKKSAPSWFKFLKRVATLRYLDFFIDIFRQIISVHYVTKKKVPSFGLISSKNKGRFEKQSNHSYYTKSSYGCYGVLRHIVRYNLE